MATERELTAKLQSFFPQHRDVVVGIGDDAAVVKQRHERTVLCCDPVVAGVHFEADAAPGLIGRKVVNRNLSDLAAMGALPDWLLVSLVVPTGTDTSKLMAVLRGIRSAAAAADCTVVGGDLATSDGPLVATVSAYGHCPGRVLQRSGAKNGDTLHVTGSLGGSILGHHLRFQPALAEGVWLARQDAVRAAMDVTDGLLLDLATLLRASSNQKQLGAELFAERIPIRPAARKLPGEPLQHALTDGEDHVLLWTQRDGQQLATGGPLTKRSRTAIGRVIAEPGLWLVQDGERHRLPAAGFQHSL